MPQFIATTARGLAEVLENELLALGVTNTKKIPGGVEFESNWEGCYRVNLHSRIASRVIKPILDFPAYQTDDIYHNVLKHDFTKYIRPDQTIRIEASVKDCKIRDQRFLAMRTKDAVVDQFREKFQVRPSVADENPDLLILIKGYNNQFSVAIDTSGESLFRRGYRVAAGEAPMKENLAAALLALADWQPGTPLIDPLCGSGTLVIEAALKAMNIAPGTLRRSFGFQRLSGYDAEVWENLVEEAIEAEVDENTVLEGAGGVYLFGRDLDRRVIQLAKDNAKRAGVDHIVDFRVDTVATAAPPVRKEGPALAKGIVVTNPPYGVRLGDEDNLKDVYRDLGYALKHQFTGWTAWVLSGNKDMMGEMRLKSTRKFPVYNGNIECRFLKYEMR